MIDVVAGKCVVRGGEAFVASSILGLMDDAIHG